MIWLYLLVLLLSATGLVVVYTEWRRGVRWGLVGPSSTFVIAFSVAVLALVWLRALDDGETRASDRYYAMAPIDRHETLEEPAARAPGPRVDAPGQDLATAPPADVTTWRSLFTPEFIASSFVTLVVTVLAQIWTTITLGRQNRPSYSLKRLR